MRNKLCLLGIRDIQEFTRLCEGVEGKIELFCPNTGYRVSAKSLLGGIATLDWSEVWVESEVDIYSRIKKFIVLGEDNETIHF